MTTRVVAIGGGHGLARALSALRRLDGELTAVVTAADDGGSSGRLREHHDIVPPGDPRRALIALARNDDLARVLAHRFDRGDLSGHALGNLLLVALTEQSGGSFTEGLRRAGELLDCAGVVTPSTERQVTLHASVSGRRVDGQAVLAQTGGHVEHVWLEPDDPPACPAAVTAVEAADAIVIGPGSLFTSLITNLLVPGLAKAVARARAPIVVVGNLRTQPGETEGLSLADHIDALAPYLAGRRIDAVLAHEGASPIPGAGQPLAADLDHPAVERVVRADLAGPPDAEVPNVGHDPQPLGEALRRTFEVLSVGSRA